MEETLDRVDENDNVVGTTTKNEAHEKGYAHRVSAVYVFMPDGKLIVQQRNDTGALDHSAAGHVASGELYEAAAKRELAEELGIKNAKLEYLGSFYADERMPTRPKQIAHHFGVFETKLTGAEAKNIKIDKREVRGLKTMFLEEIRNLMSKEPLQFATGFEFTFNFYIKNRKLPIMPVEIR